MTNQWKKVRNLWGTDDSMCRSGQLPAITLKETAAAASLV